MEAYSHCSLSVVAATFFSQQRAAQLVVRLSGGSNHHLERTVLSLRLGLNLTRPRAAALPTAGDKELDVSKNLLSVYSGEQT